MLSALALGFCGYTVRMRRTFLVTAIFVAACTSPGPAEPSQPPEHDSSVPTIDGSAARIPCPGVEFPDQVTSIYILPYPVGDAHNIRQGNCNDANTHNERYKATFAYDIEMSIGSSIVAARSGEVFLVIEKFSDEQHEIDQGNIVAIVHDDGSYAKYGHITQNGALVDVGDQVAQGQPIARSGNSGLSRGPHLHFSVKECPEGEPSGNPECKTKPLTFRNTRPHPNGLIGSPTSAIGGGEVYEALPLD